MLLNLRKSTLLAQSSLLILPKRTHVITNGRRDPDFHGTTILNVRKHGKVAMIGDGQISLGHTVFKNNAKKIRKI